MNMGFKRSNSYEGGISKCKLEIRNKPRFKKRVSNQVLSSFPKASKDMVSNPMFQKVRYGNLRSDKPTCAKCGKKNRGECLVRMDCFGLEKKDHKVRDSSNVRIQLNGSGQDQEIGPSSDDPKKNHFCDLLFRGEQEESPYLLTDMLRVISIDVYALLDSGAIYHL